MNDQSYMIPKIVIETDEMKFDRILKERLYGRTPQTVQEASHE